MKKFTLISALLLVAFFPAQAQTWDGGGGDTEWNNPLNWDTDMVPAANALVSFQSTVAVTSNSGVVVPPAQIRVQGAGTVLTLDLDLTLGSFVTLAAALRVDGFASLVVPASRTITIITGMTNDAIATPSSAGGPTITIQSGATITTFLGNRGINLGSPNAVLNNHGNITITQTTADGIFLAAGASLQNTGSIVTNTVGGDGIENAGSFTNEGTIGIVSSAFNGVLNNPTGSFTNSGVLDVADFTNITSDGINSSGTFTNEAGGTVEVDRTQDDGVELLGGTFTNFGEMTLTARNTAAAGNDVLAVGTSSSTASFVNHGTLSVNAGTGTDARALFVGREVGGSISTFDNYGMVTLAGGSSFQRLFTRGNTTNHSTGTLDSGNGLINVNRGSFVNNGLIEGNFPGTTNVSTGLNGTSLNDGFYRHNGSSFSNGVTDNITDNGVDMNDPAQTTFNLMGGCTVTVAGPGATQTWLNSLGDTVDVMGPEITFNDALPDVMSTTITASSIDVTLTVENVCLDGLLPIELLSFTATALEKSVLLEWKTANEIDNDYMVVERSTDAREFIDVGQVAGAGTTYTPRTYELVDENPVNGINYYRLRQVDLDGTINYSEIISVTFRGAEPPMVIALAPNPVRADGSVEIDLRAMSPEPARYLLTNSQGQIVKEYDLAGGQRRRIDLANLPAGLYVLSMVNAQRQSSSKLLIID